MGIVQSAIRLFDELASDHEHENERPRRSNPNYSDTRTERSHQWQNGNDYSSSTHESNVRYSYPNTTVNDKPKAAPSGARTTTFRVAPTKVEAKERTVVINTPILGGRWIKHYSSSHSILLVGDGDFSFSTCLAKAFGWASNMVATSLDSQDFLVKNYDNAPSNIMELSIRKCTVIHGIDATAMANHDFLGLIKFDRIIFNFPFAGFFGTMPRQKQLGFHKTLVSEFLRNAKEMISEKGEIHISHKTNNGFLKDWNLEGIASSHGLKLIEAVKFNLLDYPGYNTKYGFGGDRNFNCYPSKTYKFGLRVQSHGTFIS